MNNSKKLNHFGLNDEKKLKKFCYFSVQYRKLPSCNRKNDLKIFVITKKYTKPNFTKFNLTQKSEQKAKIKTPISTNDLLFLLLCSCKEENCYALLISKYLSRESNKKIANLQQPTFSCISWILFATTALLYCSFTFYYM